MGNELRTVSAHTVSALYTIAAARCMLVDGDVVVLHCTQEGRWYLVDISDVEALGQQLAALRDAVDDTDTQWDHDRAVTALSHYKERWRHNTRYKRPEGVWHPTDTVWDQYTSVTLIDENGEPCI